MPYSFKNTLRLPKEEEEKQTYAEIEEGVYFRGHNLWLLVLSMGIACVGLNINSTAAVIGAMLISPLMGPVVGLAFGLSIKDKGLIKLSLWNWTIMVATGLLASTVYFVITPFIRKPPSWRPLRMLPSSTVFWRFSVGLRGFWELPEKRRLRLLPGLRLPQPVFRRFVPQVTDWRI